ncbi:MAG TPA: hypothetical protein VHD90_20430 [Phototrophicaceae bacterium]|nr:hypothetical protein [Phototrophicaceae bacterium]
MSMTADAILGEIFDSPSDPLYAPLAEWIRADRRLRTFAERYRVKIRRKLRGIADQEGFADLQFELEVARWLLQESRFEVEYETFDARQGGPDYTVTFRVNTKFNVEVRRIRTQETGEARVRKLTDTLADKTRQMPPSAINLLVLTDGLPSGDDLVQAATALRGLAERKVEDYFAHRGYKNAADFLRQYRQLSGVFFKAESGQLWLNPLAKHPLPKDLALALERLPAWGMGSSEEM